jgi:hypothetical protein
MRNILNERAYRVVIAFDDATVSFDIPRGATLADISENLDRIARWHRGLPLSIEVRLKAATDNSCADFVTLNK